MFSVNISKLVAMTDKERDSYTSIVETLLADANGSKTFSVVGGGIKSFKLAYTLMKMGNRVLFIDGDISSDVFLGKYKLGKDMKGVVDYISNTEETSDLLCLTNENDLRIIFTGDLSAGKVDDDKAKEIEQLFTAFADDYDYFVVDADQEAVLGRHCKATAIMFEESEYSETAAEAKAKELEEKGCNVLGVIINE